MKDGGTQVEVIDAKVNVEKNSQLEPSCFMTRSDGQSEALIKGRERLLSISDSFQFQESQKLMQSVEANRASLQKM